MKKFNPEKEIDKLNKSKNKTNTSKMSNLFVPILVVACSCMAMTAVTFSAHLESDTKEMYKVHIDIINGDEETYDKTTLEGAFSDTITSSNSFGSIECTSGNLNYDPITGTISTPYLNRNTSCILAFMNDGSKKLNIYNLPTIGDNTGTSSYYKADSEENYMLIKKQMYRIVRINGDGTIRLILNDNVIASNYGLTNDYTTSNVKTLLEEWYMKNFNNEPYLVKGDFDTTNYVLYDTNHLFNEEGYKLLDVGTLSVREYALISEGTETSYISSPKGIYLANGNNIDKVYAIKNNEIVSVDPTEELSIRPVINIKANIVGKGTINNPYTIEP